MHTEVQVQPWVWIRLPVGNERQEPEDGNVGKHQHLNKQ